MEQQQQQQQQQQQRSTRPEWHARAGDAIIFDYRILHRGLANTSAEDRPLAYFTYGRSWFRDATNYSSTSILPTPPSPPTASGPLDAESYEEDPIAALQKAMQKASDWVEHRNS